MIRTTLLALASAYTMAAFAEAGEPAPPPVAPVKSVTDTYFGTAVDDPYRYFENLKDPAVVGWMKAQSAYAHAVLERLPGREAILASLTKYDAASPAIVANVTRTPDGSVFYEKRAPGENQFKLYVRRSGRSDETLLVDPEALQRTTGKPHAINFYAPSPDGTRVAYGVSEGGSEAAVLHVIDTSTGKPLGTPIDRADAADPGWSADGRTLYFGRLQALKPGMPATEKYTKIREYAWKVGTPVASARMVFGPETPGVTLTPTEAPALRVTPEGEAIVYVADGVARELSIYVTTVASLEHGTPTWRKLFGPEAKIERFAVRHGQAFAITADGAARYRLLSGPLATFPAHASVVVPESQRVLTGIAAAQDAVYIEARDGNIKRLYKLVDGRGAPVEVPLPVAGAFSLDAFESVNTVADPRLPGVVITLSGWISAPQIYAVSADGKVTNTGLRALGPYDAPDDLEATEVLVTSHDGTKVPMSIIHKKGLPMDGKRPTLLYGYASYGFTEEPRYRPATRAWYDAGGVFAVANPRGSGVFGSQWYLDGKGLKKPNTWKDFIACAQWLIDNKVTSTGKLGILGGSAGGILVGRAMTERPDLFAAVVSSVGSTDTIRAETTANGVTNIPEFGTFKTPEGFKALYEMSTYAHVVPGTKYPAVLFIHGFNDPRVDVWESAKTAARVQAATASGKPVLLRLDFDAGHGIGNTRAQQIAEQADIYSFLLWQFGETGGAGQR